MKRRHFLQFAGSTLATLGLSQLDIMQQGDKYAQVLAQNSGRKLALLVGINKYENGMNPLYGCVNDVLLQKHLLIHRFGFNPQDIKTLTDAQATRANILTEFEQHLINQAKPGDTVVFHFSGHGSRVEDPDRDEADGLNGTLVPIDSGFNAGGGVVQDIMGHTLFLLMYALKTNNVTVVLDSCHSGGAKRGNFVVRSRDGGGKFQPSSQEIAYQKQWLNKLNLSPQEFIKLRRQGVAKGVVIASAKRDQYAADVPFNGFHAGAFTYLFTQYLWQQTANQPAQRTLVDVNRSTRALSRTSWIYQEPELEVNTQTNPNPTIYFTPFNAAYAEAVVTKITGNQVELWLGGIDARSLEAFDREAAFITVNTNGQETGLVKLESRQGLVGTGKLISAARGNNAQIQPGTLLQERIRGIPENVTLKIGLDDDFDGAAKNQARQALQAVNRVTPVALGQQEIQYIFGSMTQSKYQQLQQNRVKNLPAVGSLGLFIPSLDGIVPDSFGAAKETINDAVQRLKPKFKSLLAARIVKQMVGNNNTSLIKVTASLDIASGEKVLAKAQPTRGVSKENNPANSSTKPIIQDGEIPKLPIKTQVVFNIENQESVPIYISLLVINAAGEMAVIFPNNWSASADEALLPAKTQRIIPVDNDGFKLTISEPLGVSEALIIASTSPLRNSLKALKEIATRGGQKRGPVRANTDEFLDISDKLLADLDTSTRRGIAVEGIQLATGVRGVDTKKLAAMAIAFEVVG